MHCNLYTTRVARAVAAVLVFQLDIFQATFPVSATTGHKTPSCICPEPKATLKRPRAGFETTSLSLNGQGMMIRPGDTMTKAQKGMSWQKKKQCIAISIRLMRQSGQCDYIVCRA